MARRLTSRDRRALHRVPPEETPWLPSAILRPGVDVLVLNLSGGGALIESSSRINPGIRTELQLLGESRRTVRGRIDRCSVAALNPVRYRGAIVFDERLHWHGARRG
jgi:hypothetical protein